MKTIDVFGEEFSAIFSDVKERYLSKSNFPKLIIGTGLSIAMGVPGMLALSTKLDEVFSKEKDTELLKKWEQYCSKIKENGLEAALLKISSDEECFVEKIKEITSEFILEEEYKKHIEILNESPQGLERLLKYLSETVSVNNRIIDIMTPNYDRIIEIICDKLSLTTNLGFIGTVYQRFNEDVLRFPYSFYDKNTTIVRVFKPHGSINWIKDNGREYQINDYNYLKKKIADIDIITPGSMKYKYGLINDIFRCHRENFNKILSERGKNYSLFIYGYGFNDDHFNTVFENTTNNIIVLTFRINNKFYTKALENENWTVFYKEVEGNEENIENGRSYMIYKCEKYEINNNLWDLTEFAKIFLG